MALRLEGGKVILSWRVEVEAQSDLPELGETKEALRASSSWKEASLVGEAGKGSAAWLVAAVTTAGEAMEEGDPGLRDLRIRAEKRGDGEEVAGVWTVECEAEVKDPRALLRCGKEALAGLWNSSLTEDSLEAAAFEIFQGSSPRPYSPSDAGFSYLSTPIDLIFMGEGESSAAEEAEALLEAERLSRAAKGARAREGRKPGL